MHEFSNDILQIRRGDEVYDKKKVNSLQKQSEQNLKNLQLVRSHGGLQGQALAALNDEIEAAKKLDKTFNKITRTNDYINKQLGFLPQVAAGFDKVLSRMGIPNLGIKDALDETHKLGQEASQTGKRFYAMSTFLGQVKNNLSNSFTTANLLQGSLALMVTALVTGDKAIGDLAKGMNLSYSEANKVRGELTTIAATSGDVALNTRGLQETLMHVGSQLGSNAKLNEADLKTFTKLREQAGFTNDELYGIQQLSLVNGKSLEKNSKEILGGAKAYSARNKLMLNEKDILRDVSTASASLKLTLGGSADKLAEAAAKARQFGVSLQQAESISQSLLNFESSIENE